MSRFYMLLLGSAAFAGVAVFGFVPANAADAKAEITIAGQHASMAASASDLATTHAHLHHTLNCIEGPTGADFSKTDINPCQNAGNGAIPDSKDAAVDTALQTAITHAKAGLASDELASAQAEAKAAATALQAIK